MEDFEMTSLILGRRAIPIPWAASYPDFVGGEPLRDICQFTKLFIVSKTK